MAEKLVQISKWSILFVGGKDTGMQPKSCFNCPHMLKKQQTCEYMNSGIILRKVSVDGKRYTPVCGYQIGGLPKEIDNPVYMGKDPDELGLEWAEGTGTNCDGYAGGAPCKHFIPTHDHDGICEVVTDGDAEVDWDDCCAAHDGPSIPWKEAQRILAKKLENNLLLLGTKGK